MGGWLVICLGEVTGFKVERSLVFARGQIRLEELDDSVVFCGGRLTAVGSKQSRNVIVAPAGVLIDESHTNVYINTPARNPDTGQGDRDVTEPRLPPRE